MRNMTGKNELPHVGNQVIHRPRGTIRIPVRFILKDKEIGGYTEKFTKQGLRLIVDAALPAGTPLNLQCSFGEMCYLNLSGCLASCKTTRTGVPEAGLTEITFSGI